MAQGLGPLGCRVSDLGLRVERLQGSIYIMKAGLGFRV